MSYWSSQTIAARLKDVVAHAAPNSIHQGALELRLGPQIVLSGEKGPKPIDLQPGQAVSIPEGQLALLLTEEEVKLPADVLAFISLKTKVKSKGLMNVSGFHVDPGFQGRLKFWVYNVGNQEIILRRGDPLFLIWFGEFDQKVRDPYERPGGPDRNVVTSDDLNNMRGQLCSPAVLQAEIKLLKDRYDWLNVGLWTVITLLAGLYIGIIALVIPKLMEESKPTEIRLNVTDHRVAQPQSPDKAPYSVQFTLPTAPEPDSEASKQK